MCRGCLFTPVRLQDKEVQCPTNCVSCGGLHKKLAHICFECHFTMKVWHMIGLWNVVHEAFLENNSAVNAIFKSLHKLSREFGQ